MFFLFQRTNTTASPRLQTRPMVPKVYNHILTGNSPTPLQNNRVTKQPCHKTTVSQNNLSTTKTQSQTLPTQPTPPQSTTLQVLASYSPHSYNACTVTKRSLHHKDTVTNIAIPASPPPCQPYTRSQKNRRPPIHTVTK